MAVLALRGDCEYLANNLGHLAENGVAFAIIDNGMGAEGRAVLARPPIRCNLVGFRELAYEGQFDLKRQIDAKQAMVDSLGATWVIHVDADEIMHSYAEEETLSQAISRVDGGGWTAIDFDEFVFLPIDADYRADSPGWQPLRHYYCFQPKKPRLMRAWKRSAGLALSPAAGGMGSGGHVLHDGELKLAPESFALRHYIMRSQAHALQKYCDRRYSEVELAHGWHGNRVGIARERFVFPPAARLRRLASPASRAFDRSSPETSHYWQW